MNCEAREGALGCKVNCEAREGALGCVEYLFEYLAEEGYLPRDGTFEFPEEENEELSEDHEEEEEEDFTVGLVIELPQKIRSNSRRKACRTLFTSSKQRAL